MNPVWHIYHRHKYLVGGAINFQLKTRTIIRLIFYFRYRRIGYSILYWFEQRKFIIDFSDEWKFING